MLIEIHKEDERGNVYMLKEPLVYGTLTVPAGFESDGASVPRIFWSIVFPPGETKALRAAFIHDFLYRTHPEGWTKEKADKLFRCLLIEDGIPEFRATLAYCGVRWFGSSSWNFASKNSTALSSSSNL